jgi:hypothetical protein
MIPTVEERKIRQCRECSHYVPDSESWDELCNLTCKTMEHRYYEKHPSNCKSNFTREEIQELIDQHNKKEAGE